MSLAIDGDPRTGWAVDGNVKHENRIAWFAAADPFGFPEGSELRVRLRFESIFGSHSIGRARLAITTDPASANLGKLPRTLAPILAKPREERSKKEQENVQRHYRKQFWPALEQVNGRIEALKSELQAAKKKVPNVMVMAEMETPRETFILDRGQFNQPGEKVQPGVLASLPALPPDAPGNRLALARWITDPQHPLMARVTVNRLWKQVMGTGLVKTLNDFGSQAEWPSHPGVAGLACNGVYRERLGREADDAHDRDLRCLPAVGQWHPERLSVGPGESPVCSRATFPALRGGDSATRHLPSADC